MIWERLIKLEKDIIAILDRRCKEYNEEGMDRFNNDTWVNRTWSNMSVRRAHVDVVDARVTKGLWMAHICLFPNLNNGGPIYGFDVIAGKNKMTGAFHDFSPSSDPDHPMIQGYFDSVEHFVPEKQRELPEWARNIFTGKMLAAGNVKSEEEANEIIRIALSNLHAYFDEVGATKGEGDTTLVQASQDYYCHNQQQNPHTPNVMKSLGLNEDDVDKFCTDMLFPKIG